MDRFLAANPSYPLFDHIAEHCYVKLDNYELKEDDNWQIDFAAMEKKITRLTRAIIIISPNNPTGHILCEEEAKKVESLAIKYDLAIIVDEVFEPFQFDDSLSSQFSINRFFAKAPLVFILNGVSKMFALPWLKCGWIAVMGSSHLKKHACDHLETYIDTYLSCNTFAGFALPDLFKHGIPFVEHYQQIVAERRLRALKLLKSCHRISFVEPQGGFYMVLKLHIDSLDEEEMVLQLLERHQVYFYPGFFFNLSDQNGPHLILSFLLEVKPLESGIKELISFLMKNSD